MQPKDVFIETNPKRKKKKNRYMIEKFDDLYHCTNEDLGEGACGTVKTYFSRDRKQECAVKIIKKTNDQLRLKVLKEIEILHHCRGHENIVQMHEFYEEDKCFYLVFEKMEGGTMLSEVESYGPLSEWDASKVIGGVANALKYLHGKNVAHRDIKLENILCSSREGIFPVKLCDFDLCSEPSGKKYKSDYDLGLLASAVGSVDYMAPEVVRLWLNESSHYTIKCDMWSLGVVLFILLCGTKPFNSTHGETCYCKDENDECEYCLDAHFETIMSGKYTMDNRWDFISDEAIDLVGKLLEKDPQKRYTPEQVLQHPWITNPAPMHTVSTPIPCSAPYNVRRELPYDSEASSWLSYCYTSDDDMNLSEGIFILDLNDYPIEESTGESWSSRQVKERRCRLDSFDSGNVSGFSPLGSPAGPTLF